MVEAAADASSPALAEVLRDAGLYIDESQWDGMACEYIVSGNTFNHKELLRKCGGRWSKRRNGWAFADHASLARVAEALRGRAPNGDASTPSGLSDSPGPYVHDQTNRRRDDRRKRKRYLGHRERLRDRFLEVGPASLPDYELLELLLYFSIDVRDTKPLAKDLLKEFGSLGGVLNADPERLHEIEDLPRPSETYLEWLRYWKSPAYEADGEALARGEEIAEPARQLRAYQGTDDWQRQGDLYWSWRFTAVLFKVVREFAQRLHKEELKDRPVIGSWSALTDYLQVALAHEPIEQFRLLFLDRKNILIRDEVQQRGTVDHTPLYPREIVKRALDLQASAIIMVHNHPSGDPTPSRADIEMTRQVVQALGPVGITVHDHVIIGKNRHTSFRSQGLI